MKYDTEDYGSDYSSSNYGSSYGGSDSFDGEPIEPIEVDYGSALGVVKSDVWRKATPAQRGKTVDLAFTRLIESAELHPERKVMWTNRQGEAKEIPLLNPDRSWSASGKEWLQQQRSYLEAAAEDETGGVKWDKFDQDFVVPEHLSPLLERQKQFDAFHDLGNWMQEKKSIETEDETASLTWEDFVAFANADVKSDEAKIDVENKELKKQWAQRMARELYTPETLGENVMMEKVGGQWVLNSMNYSEIDKMENAINSNEELSPADKKLLLADYRGEVEKNADKIVNAFATADAGVIGSMFSRPLNDEFNEEMGKTGASAYEFIKARKDRFSKDSYGVTSELAAKLRDAVMATGTGALWAASFGNYTSPAEAFGGLAEDTSKAYSNTTQFSVFGIDITRRDLTSLTGQVGSFFAMGGMGALAGKGLANAGAVGASRYAVGEGGKLVLKSTTARAASLVAAEDVLKAGGNLPKVSFPAKMGGWLKAAATDPELYIGSLQAAGMGFGSAFNEAYERTGNRDEALKAANIEGISNGLAVMIATGVMNRVAPGMGKALGMGDEGVGTSLIQNLRNKVVQKEGMEATQKSLEHLAGDAGAGLRKQFAKDIAQEMNDAARKMGLKGIGIAGNVGAEAVEEMADSIISDSISSILDHSKTWKEDFWGNIGENWKEYVKAGILGAIGGGMGASLGTVTNAPQVFGKSDALNAMSDTWKAIETNIGNFGNDSFKMDVGGKAMSVSEMLSNELDPNQQIDMEKKSAMLVRAARGIGLYQTMPSSLRPDAPRTAPAGAAAVNPTGSPKAAPAGAQKAYPQGSLGHIMQSIGEAAPAGREWSGDAKAVEGSPSTYSTKLGKFKITPIHAVSDANGGKRNDNVAFKVEEFTSKLGKKTFSAPFYETPAQAQKRLNKIGIIVEARKLDRIVNATPEEKAQQYDEWTNETSEQGAASNGTSGKVETASEKSARISAEAKAASDLAASSARGTEQTPSDNTGAPVAAAVKAKPGDKLTYSPSDGSAPVEVEFRGWDDSTFDLSGKASKAFVKVGGKDKTVQTSSLSLAPAKDSASAQGSATIGKTSFDPMTGETFIETTSKKNGKKFGITAEPSKGGTKWTISEEDSKNPGTYSGSIPMDQSERRANAVKALGEDVVNRIEAAHALAQKEGYEGSEKAIPELESLISSIASKEGSAPTAPTPAAAEVAAETKPMADGDKLRGPSTTGAERLVFDTESGGVYLLYDQSLIPEDNKNLDGASIAVRGYERSNDAGGFKLRKLEGEERSKAVADNNDHAQVKYGPNDVIYSAIDYTGRVMNWSAGELTFVEPITSILKPSKKGTESKASPTTPTPAAVAPVPKRKGIFGISSVKLAAMFNSAKLSALVDRILGDGVDVVSHTTWEGAMGELGLNVKDHPELPWAALAWVKSDGTKVIILNQNTQDNFNKDELVKTMIHEFIHIKEMEFGKTKEGRALRDSALSALVKGDPHFDTELEQQMLEEFSGYDGLDTAGKFHEVIRAIVEGRLLNYTSGMGSPLSEYLKAFLKFIKGFNNDTNIGSYATEVQNRVAAVIGDISSFAESKPKDKAPPTPAVEPLDSLIAELEKEIEEESTQEESKEPDSNKKEESPPVNLPPTEKAAVEVAEEVLTDEDKARFSESIGEKSWTKKTAVRFVGMMNDWVASGQKAFGKMTSLFKKVWAKIKKNAGKASVIISVSSMMGISPTANIDTVRDNRSDITTSAPANHPGFTGLPTDYVDTPMDAETKAILQNGAAYVYDVEQAVNITIAETPAGKIDPSINPDPVKKADLKGATLSSHAQRMANWVVANGDNAGKMFVIADKKAGTASFFDKSGVLIRHVPALYGKTIGDFTTAKILAKDTMTVSSKEKITPSGRFETWNKRSTTGNGLVAVYTSGSATNLAFHKVYLGKPSENREHLLATPTGDDNRITHGCINLTEKDAKELIPLMDDGSVTYILPETEEGVKSFKGFEEIIANEAGANPLSALLLSLAMLAKARRNNGSTKKDVAAEVEKLIAESNLSNDQKDSARSRMGLAIEQTTWEESKPKPNQTNEKQTEDKRDKAEGLQVEETETEDGESTLTPEERIAESFAEEGYDIDREIIAEEYKKTGALPTENRRVDAATRAIRARLESEGGAHTPMRAAAVADAPDVVAGLDPESTYIVEAGMLDGGTDAAGAKWRRMSGENGKERYGYMPPKGMASTMGVGDTVVIAGNDKQVLMLKKVVDGELIFEALNIDFNPNNQNSLNDQLRQNSNKYTRSILDKSIKSIVPMMSRFSNGQISLDEVKSIFNELLSVVAPKNNFKVVERKLDEGDKFLFAEPAEKDSNKQSAIIVDYEKLKKQLVKLYFNSDTNNEFAQSLLAYDAAALISTLLSEEGIHIVTYGTFTGKELRDYYNNLWYLNDEYIKEQKAKGVSEDKIKNHPIYEELVTVAKERGVTKDLNPNSKNKVTNEQRQEIAGELLRKFVQMALSGTTTERQSQLSRMLQHAMVLDESNSKEKGSLVKYLKAIGHMVRRYAERMRNILWINTHRGMLPSNLQEPLRRLIDATKASGMNVDVLNAHSDAIRSQTKMEELYNKSLESEIQTIARNNSFPLRLVRKRLATSNRTSIDEAIVHDPETMEIGLHPDFRELLVSEKEVDMKALDEQFDRLNGKGGFAEDQTPALKKVMTGVFLKWQKLQLLRDSLPAQFTDMDLWTGAMKPDREGITRIDREKLFTKLFEDMTGSVSHSQVIEGSEAIKQARLDSVKPRITEARMAHQALEEHAREELDGLDLSTFAGKRKLIEWSKAMRLNPHSIDLGRLNRDLAVGVDLETRYYIADQDSTVTPEELAVKMENHLKLLLQRLPMWADAMGAIDQKNEFGKGLRGDAKALFDDYVAKEQAVVEEIQAIRKAHNERIQHIKNLPDSDLLPKTEQRDGTSEDYKGVIAFTRAVDDYNRALKTAKNRAIGEFGLRTVGFGTAVKVLAINPESENPNSYSSLPEVLIDPDDVLASVKDVGYAHVYPYEHPDGYNNENADAPYSYSSRYIYPRNEQGNITQTDTGELVMGRDPNSKWERPGDENLTPQEREWNLGLERYRHGTESNFNASGRNAFADFFVAENIGAIRNIKMIDTYAQTAGFAFDKTTNPDDDSVRYESLWEAMPIFDHQRMSKLVGGLRRLKKGHRGDNNEPPIKVIADLFAYLEEMRQWSTKIRSLYQNPEFMPKIGKMQTLAGRSLSIFDQAFSNETGNGKLTNGLDLQIRKLHEELMGKVMEYVEVKSVQMDRGYLTSANTLKLDKNGLPILKVDQKKTADLAENLLKLLGDSSQKVNFDRSLYEAVQAVNLVRKQTQAFMDRRWRRNVEQEGNRAITDPAYIPEYEQLEKLRGGALSPRTLKNLSFAMSYFEKERDYQFSANFGFEMLESFDRFGFGAGQEPYVYTESKKNDVYLTDSEADLVTTKADGTITHPNVPEYSELKQDKDGRYFYNKQFSRTNFNEIVVSPQQAGFDDPRSRPFMTGEESPLLEGMDEVKSGGVSSQRETAQRRAQGLDTAIDREVAKWSLLIGSNTTNGRSATAGRIFYFDLLQADQDGFVTVEEVLEDRRRMKTAPRYGRTQTFSRRVDGNPFDATDDAFVEEQFETMEEFSADELGALDQTQLRNYFRVMRDKSLVERGLVGIFPNINPARKEFFDEIRKGFLESYGSENGYNFTSSEKFLHDLASFKSSFERDMIDRAIIKDKGVGSMALQTISEYSDVDTLSSDDAISQFNAKKKKQSSAQSPKSFATAEEARNIWRLMHSEVMKPENSRQVVDASQVTLLNSTVGPIIEQFLLTLSGNTIAVLPNEATAAKHQLSDTGIRIFEGRDGNPNVIYVPQIVSIRDKRMVDESVMVIAQSLSINSKTNPSIKKMVNDLAGKVNEVLDPITRAQTIESQMSPVGKWKKSVVDISESTEAIEANFKRLIEGSPVEFTEKQQVRIRQLVTDQFIKSIELARELQISELTADQIALFGGDPTFATNLLLVGTILSNAKAKQFFDQAYSGIESLAPSSLPDVVGDSLINAVLDIARSGEVEHGGTEADWISESSVIEKTARDIESDQNFDENESDNLALREQRGKENEVDDTDSLAEANKLQQAMLDGDLDVLEQEETDMDAMFASTSGFSDEVKAEIMGMIKANGGNAYFAGKSPLFSDSDIALINGLNSIIASAMNARKNVQPLKPSRDAREMLEEPGRLRDEDEIRGNELAQPVVASVGWKDNAGKIYVGEAKNLGRPLLPGNRTSLTQGFAEKRIRNMNANVLQLSPYIHKWVKLRVEESIRQSLEKTRIDAANNKSSLDYSQLKRFGQINLEIEMSDEIIEQLRSILPSGYMKQAEQDVKDEIARLEENVSKMTEAQAKKYQELAGALSQRVPFPRQEVTKEVSDMMGYPQRFAQRLADMLQENILFEEGKADQVAKGMSAFVRRQFGNDPLFKAAFNQMATLLDTMNRELSVRHVFEEQNEDTVLIESGANPFRTIVSPQENETRIGDLIRSYNANVDVVNLVLDSMAKQGMALIGVDGSTKGYRLPHILGSPESISPQDLISLRRRSFGVDSTAKFKGQLMQHAERTIASAFADSIAQELAGIEGKTKQKSIPVGKDTRRNSEVKNFIKLVRQLMEEGRELDNFDLASEITAVLNKMTNRLKSDPGGQNFSEYIQSVYKSFAEEDSLYDRSQVTDDASYVNKGQTAEQRDLVNKLEIQLGVIASGLAANQAALDVIDHTDYKQLIGKTYHRGVVGVPSVGVGDNQVLAGIEPMLREAGVNITLVAPGLNAGDVTRETWAGDQPSMDEASSAGLKARRRAFYAQKEAVVRALSEFAEERLEDVYRDERNTEENFLDFDPLGTIQKSVELAKIEIAMLDDRFSQAKTEAKNANYRGMTDYATALFTDPKDGVRYNLLKVGQKKAVNLIRLPQNFEDRRDRIGMYHNEGGMGMILMPTTAADEMIKAFPTVTKKNVNSEIAHVAMAAISLTQPQTNQNNSYFFDEVNKNTDATFTSSGKKNESTNKDIPWRLAKEGMTRAEVADAFADEFEERIGKWLNQIRNHNGKGKVKSIKMDGRITKAAMSQTKALIRQIVLAYSSGKLEGNRYITVKDDVMKFMAMIDDVDTDLMGADRKRRSFTFKDIEAGKLITESMQLFKVEQTFSKVFSALEADLIAKRLVAGMTVSDSNTDLTMMRLAHHHDARIRARFRKSLAAKQAVRHLVGILDHGFDGVSGREGYETSRKIAKEKIGEAARKVGSSAKNHAIGYLLAQLRGIKDAHGMSLSHAYSTWAKQQNLGHLQAQSFVTAQEKKYGKNKAAKYWSGGHLDLVRDQPLAAELDKIMRKATSVISISTNDPDADIKAQKAITDLEEALIKEIEDNKQSEVNEYSKTLSDIFTDIDAAMHLSLALSSKKGRDIDSIEEKSKWKHDSIEAFKPTATNVPMRLGYAKDPTARKQGREGRYITDPIEVVSLDQAAFFGGIAKGEPFERNRVYRPVMVNGLSTPLSIVDDAIYRLNVTPSYEILRRSIGKVRALHGPIEIIDSDMEETLGSFGANADQFSTIREMNAYYNDRHRWKKDANTALAAVAYELETIVQNDSAIGTAQTGGAETLRFFSALYIMRALASPLQWWDQSVSPSFGYTVGKLVANKHKSVGLYYSTLAKMLTSRKFSEEVGAFIQDTSPYVYYRASDGQDVAEDMIRGQERYGVGQTKAKLGRGFRGYERFAEKALSFTIGKPERLLAGTIYMVELAEKMKATTVEEVLNRKADVSDGLAQQAKLKVNDVMAQSDQSKKSWFFQTRDQNPVLNAFWRSLVRFSNHTASMASNTAVLTQTMFTRQEDGLSEMDDYYVSKQDAEDSRREAMENVATTLTQNILFYPMKLKALLPAVLYLIFKAGDDDDDEAALRAQKVSNDLIAPNEDASVIHKYAMALIFGKERPLFQDRGTVDEAQASAFAEMINYTSQEALTTIPLIGVAFGYSPVRGLIDKAFTNPGSEEAAALLMNVDRDTVNIREYRPGFLENTAEFTAPTGAAYDYAAAAKLLLDYNMTGQAANDRGVSLRDSLFYLLSEALPGTREVRSYYQGKLREPVNDEKR